MSPIFSPKDTILQKISNKPSHSHLWQTYKKKHSIRCTLTNTIYLSLWASKQAS